MPPTAVIITVQHLVEGMIYTWQIMRVTITILALTVTHTQALIVTIISGLETLISAQMSWRFITKCLLKGTMLPRFC